ncbi:PPE domain-containing protein [Mycolicibacterium sp. P1-18]|uniref:PPE domain-containing protein n=1 Tax=Mycolicibacterium sp. P1-18 TaxID=2024615 RepID=UPI0011F2D117|nr:PPE domain-containing protein [Mycolicibacterium sp. P1-18]KAA0093542.1 PPE domain-containing protein [Mycolicibacterium sp. P1-18]
MAFGEPSAIPPEGNYLNISLGDLAASLTAAAAGHQGLADMLLAELTQVQATAATTAAAGWQGAGGVAMVGSAQEYAAALELAATWCLQAFAQATEVAMAHQTAMTSMIPAPVCTTNLATTQALCDTNFFGQNSPAIAALIAQYQEFWTQNASLANGYQAVITQAVAMLSTPPPLSPTAANPAGPAAAAAANSAQSATQGALQTSAKSMTETADATGGAGTSAASPMGSMSSMFGQLSSMGGQFSSMGGQLPQLLTSAPSQLSGMFGPMSSMFSGMGGAQGAAAIAPGAAGPLTTGGATVPGLGGAGGGGAASGVFTSAPASATMVRPASSFSSGSAPRLPGGWPAGGAGPAEPVAAPSSGGGGGLYGAPAGAGMAGNRDQNSSSERTADRTMQVTGRPGYDREEKQRR